jgi:hypothetical protein
MILSIGVALTIVSVLSFLIVDNFGNCVPERKLKILLGMAGAGIVLMAIGVWVQL